MATATPTTDREGQSVDLTGQIALECLGSDTFNTRLGDASGLSLLNSLLADPLARVLHAQGHSDQHDLLHELPYETRASLPSFEASRRLTDTYFEHCDFFSPILSSRDDFFHTIQPLYDSPMPQDNTPKAKFRAFMVFGTSVLLLNRSNPSVPVSKSEGYFAAAITIMSQKPREICTGDLDHLVNILLIIQHCCFISNLTAAWHFIGLATRLAVELHLHDERNNPEETHPSLMDTRRWLFWATYMFERNLCVIIGRPFSIPDSAIETALPAVDTSDPRRVMALHLIKFRRLESEIHVTLFQDRPLNGYVLDKKTWRDDMRCRLKEWHATVPTLDYTSQLAPADMFSGLFFNAMVLLYYPSNLFPFTSDDELRHLAEYAISSIDCYKDAFTTGRLRFYWRTVHNLFRSGIAIAYCACVRTLQPQFDAVGLDELSTWMNSCSSILWGMVERYPAGKSYRDIFEKVVNAVRMPQSHLAGESLANPMVMHIDESMGIFDQISDSFSDTDLPVPAMNALSWGFGGSQGS